MPAVRSAEFLESVKMCLYWIHKCEKTFSKKEIPNERVQVIEMDELYRFLEREKPDLLNDTCE